MYIVECSDNSLYTGITTDVDIRVYEHNNDNKKASAKKSSCDKKSCESC